MKNYNLRKRLYRRPHVNSGIRASVTLRHDWTKGRFSRGRNGQGKLEQNLVSNTTCVIKRMFEEAKEEMTKEEVLEIQNAYLEKYFQEFVTSTTNEGRDSVDTNLIKQEVEIPLKSSKGKRLDNDKGNSECIVWAGLDIDFDQDTYSGNKDTRQLIVNSFEWFIRFMKLANNNKVVLKHREIFRECFERSQKRCKASNEESTQCSNEEEKDEGYEDFQVKVAAPTKVSDDGFVEVTRKHGNGKQTAKTRHIDGVRSQSKEMKEPSAPQPTNKGNDLLDLQEINIVSLHNSFDAFMKKDKKFEVNNETWKASNDISIMDDSDSEEVENVFVKDNEKLMNGLVDDARVKVEATPKKTPRKT
nr:hypothetical protein [Tanacetum cinerariifolium]